MDLLKWAQASEVAECHMMLAGWGKREGFLGASKIFGRIMGFKGFGRKCSIYSPNSSEN